MQKMAEDLNPVDLFDPAPVSIGLHPFFSSSYLDNLSLLLLALVNLHKIVLLTLRKLEKKK